MKNIFLLILMVVHLDSNSQSKFRMPFNIDSVEFSDMQKEGLRTCELRYFDVKWGIKRWRRYVELNSIQVLDSNSYRKCQLKEYLSEGGLWEMIDTIQLDDSLRFLSGRRFFNRRNRKFELGREEVSVFLTQSNQYNKKYTEIEKRYGKRIGSTKLDSLKDMKITKYVYEYDSAGLKFIWKSVNGQERRELIELRTYDSLKRLVEIFRYDDLYIDPKYYSRAYGQIADTIKSVYYRDTGIRIIYKSPINDVKEVFIYLESNRICFPARYYFEIKTFYYDTLNTMIGVEEGYPDGDFRRSKCKYKDGQLKSVKRKSKVKGYRHTKLVFKYDENGRLVMVKRKKFGILKEYWEVRYFF